MHPPVTQELFGGGDGRAVDEELGTSCTRTAAEICLLYESIVVERATQVGALQLPNE